jgi:hypothetical protein
MLSVGADDISRSPGRLAVEKIEVPRGEDDARREALDVPVPRRGQRLVEIVDVEENVPLRRREAAEIHQVSVAARLHPEPGGRGRRHVGGHDRGGAAIESERRLRHPPEADRD